MTPPHPLRSLTGLPLAVGMALLAAPAAAVTFNIGEIEGQLDTRLSIGASWATAGADKDLIGAANGGHGLASISDDGRLNFRSGETFSKLFKGTHELELKRGEGGLFVSGRYWYDFELMDGGRPFKDIDNGGRQETARAAGARLLDAYAYRHYRIGEQPGSVRLGRQVVNWGESAFLQSGIGAINPIDVSAFRRPGAEFKDGLLPVNLLHLSQSLSDALSMEAFYQLTWKRTAVDNCGTFFSQSDVMAAGCDANLAVLSRQSALSPAAIAQLQAGGVTWGDPDEGVVVPRGKDRKAGDGGQWGLAVHYFAEPLDTDFGAYYINYHSRLPILGGVAADRATFAAAAGLPAGQAPLLVAGNSSYFVEYPEDIHLYGLSFSSTLPSGTLWRGEISYRPNAPVQLSISDILGAGLTPLDAQAALLQASPGQTLHGYRRKEITQLQTSFTHYVEDVMGASRLTLVGEVGWTHVGGLESRNRLRYGRDPVFGSGPLAGNACQALNALILQGAAQDNLARYCENRGFTTADSWGYRLRATWDYNDAFLGVDLKPSLAWSHDVSGYSPSPGGNFEEGRKAVSLGLDADYRDTYSASLAYTNFFGGRYSTAKDRDFLTMSLGVKF